MSERVDNLRGRRFNVSRLWKVGSISARLAAKANKSITLIGTCATKNLLLKELKNPSLTIILLFADNGIASSVVIIANNRAVTAEAVDPMWQ